MDLRLELPSLQKTLTVGRKRCGQSGATFLNLINNFWAVKVWPEKSGPKTAGPD